MRHGLLNRMACTQLGLLPDRMHVGLSVQQCLDLISPMTRDHPNVAGLQANGGIHDVLQQSLATHSVKNFGHTALHAGAFTRCHDDHIQF